MARNSAIGARPAGITAPLRDIAGSFMTMLRSTVIGFVAIALLWGLLAGLVNRATARTLVISSWGGPYGASQREAYFEPFTAATGIRIVEDDWGGDLTKLRHMVTNGRYRSHVLDAESGDVSRGCAEDLLEPIDYARLGISPQDMLVGAALPCGVGNVAWSMVLVFDSGRLHGRTPAHWADFFDLARFPGGRGLRRGVFGNLEIALMADGVAPEQVYAVLHTPAGRERAFTKLLALEPHVVWWEAGRQPARLLVDGEAVMTTAWSGRIQRAITRHRHRFEIVWRGQLVDYGYWIIPKGHPQADLAYRFIAFAVRPDRQAAQSRHIPYGPLRKGAFEHIAPDVARWLPTAPAHLDTWLRIDAEFWLEHREALSEQFEARVGEVSRTR